jgi:hypothetical protein
MSLKLIVGLCRKVGKPNFGPASASCNAEVQLNSTLDDRDAFHQAAKTGFTACEKAVNDQLAGGANGAGNHHPGSNQQNGNGNGWRQASEKQMNYINQLAGRTAGLDGERLSLLTEKMFGVPSSALSSFDASRLIDVLKQVQAGVADLEPVLGEE